MEQAELSLATFKTPNKLYFFDGKRDNYLKMMSTQHSSGWTCDDPFWFDYQRKVRFNLQLEGR